MKFYICDGEGYFEKEVDVQSEALAELNTPAGGSFTDEPPPSHESWREASGWVGRPAQPSLAHRWDRASRMWTDPRTLDDRRAEAWARIKQMREADEFGSFTWDGSRFDANPVSIQRIQGAAQMALMSIGAGVARTFEWTLADNTARTLSANEMVQVGLALGTHIDDQHKKGRRLRKLLDAATTASELDAIKWSEPPQPVGQP